MAQLSPFRGWRVRQDAAPWVVPPPLDAMTAAQRRSYAASEPDSFLNVLRSATDHAGDPDEPLAASRATLERLVAQGAFEHIDRPAHHVLQMRVGTHVQTGIVGTVPVRDLGDRVLAHEATRTDREEELVRHLEVVGVSSSPVGLVHRGPTPVPDLVDEVTGRAPSLELQHDDGLHEQVWTVTDADELARVREGFADITALYLTDGHHRAAAAQRHATRRRAGAGPTPPPDAPWEQFLVVAFPEPQLQLLPYHRVVVDLGSHRPAQVVEAMRRDFDVEQRELTEEDTAAPAEPGTFAVHVGGRWYAVRVRADSDAERHREADPVSQLDVTVLQERILAGILGIEDARTDPRLEFVPGTRGPADIARRAGPDGAAFVVAPPSLRQVMAVADAGRVMPPKSTWFEPKLRPGVFLHWVGEEPEPPSTG